MLKALSPKISRLAVIASILPLLSATYLLTASYTAGAFSYDQSRGVFTLAPLLKKAKASVVRIQLGTRRWSKGKAGPGGIGSGFVVDGKRGIILTNRHVVKGARRIYALTSNGKSYRARVIGTNKAVDLAVLKIETSNLTALPMGNSENIEIGDMNIVVGFPFGLAMSSSIGIISAGGGKINGRYKEDRHSLQTDAAINPGNSGGPFLNSKGEVVGVNTSILGDNGGTSLGIGFGIPINVAKRTMNKILRRNRMAAVVQEPRQNQVASLAPSQQTIQTAAAIAPPQAIKIEQNPTLGLTLQSLTSSLGVLIKKVDIGSLANLAGLQSGDTILKIDNASISDSKQLARQIETHKASQEKVRVIFKRGKFHYETFLSVMAG